MAKVQRNHPQMIGWCENFAIFDGFDQYLLPLMPRL